MGEKYDTLKELDEKVVYLLNEFFEDEWGKIKKELKDVPKKEALRQIFIAGGMFHKEMNDKIISNLVELMKKDPKEFEKLADGFKKEMDKGSI